MLNARVAEDLCAGAYEGAEESRVTGPTENIGLNLKLVVKVRETMAHTQAALAATRIEVCE